MLFRLHPESGVPIYLQLVRQVIHAIETGALRPGDQLPTIRSVAEEAVTNPNTVAKAYRELEYEGVIELRQGLGAFVHANPLSARQTEGMKRAHRVVGAAVNAMRELGLSEASMRRVFEAELTKELEASVVASSRR
ncbi:MAG: GntR family transcriptional regulator [Terriglobia bacterium]